MRKTFSTSRDGSNYFPSLGRPPHVRFSSDTRYPSANRSRSTSPNINRPTTPNTRRPTNSNNSSERISIPRVWVYEGTRAVRVVIRMRVLRIGKGRGMSCHHRYYRMVLCSKVDTGTAARRNSRGYSGKVLRWMGCVIDRSLRGALSSELKGSK
jgi:hypothetical protein